MDNLTVRDNQRLQEQAYRLIIHLIIPENQRLNKLAHDKRIGDRLTHLLVDGVILQDEAFPFEIFEKRLWEDLLRPDGVREDIVFVHSME